MTNGQRQDARSSRILAGVGLTILGLAGYVVANEVTIAEPMPFNGSISVVATQVDFEFSTLPAPDLKVSIFSPLDATPYMEVILVNPCDLPRFTGLLVFQDDARMDSPTVSGDGVDRNAEVALSERLALRDGREAAVTAIPISVDASECPEGLGEFGRAVVVGGSIDGAVATISGSRGVVDGPTLSGGDLILAEALEARLSRDDVGVLGGLELDYQVDYEISPDSRVLLRPDALASTRPLRWAASGELAPSVEWRDTSAEESGERRLYLWALAGGVGGSLLATGVAQLLARGRASSRR